MTEEEKNMSIDGIWTNEIYGPYGWENSGVYTLENGRIIGGSSRHYSAGQFRFSDGKYEADVEVHYYGPPRTVFGRKREAFEISLRGNMTENVIEGKIENTGNNSTVLFRMTKRMDIPKLKGTSH